MCGCQMSERFRVVFVVLAFLFLAYVLNVWLLGVLVSTRKVDYLRQHRNIPKWHCSRDITHHYFASSVVLLCFLS